ncbi:MAG: hypothetical protein Kow0037_28880 [Calditrichia bacterium]
MKLKTFIIVFGVLMLIYLVGCERDINSLDPADYPSFAEVFIDDFVSGLNYSAFGNSKLDAFEIDDEVAYSGYKSMKITVPSVNDPAGWYAGGAFYSKFPRDLSGYNALTFWAKASRTAVTEVGLGNDNHNPPLYQASMSNVRLGSSWQKYIVPIPDPAKLKTETGMFWYAAGADENGLGFTIWFDEVKYERLNTIAYPRILLSDTLLSGPINAVLEPKVNGVVFNVDGVDQTVLAAPAYFTLTSLNDSVATTTAEGTIIGMGNGQTKVVIQLGDMVSDTITVIIGDQFGPGTPAPTPTVHPDSVLSLYSNAYSNHPNIVWNTYWQYSTAQLEEVQVAGDDVLKYTELNFVGIEFTSPLVDASNMNRFHMDIWTPEPTDPPVSFKVKLVDFGANGVYGGGDDSEHELTFTANTTPALASKQWVGIDVPLSAFSGLASTEHLAQMVFSGDISTVYVDNVYFYNDGSGGQNPTEPTSPAPTPTYPAGNVISIFSDAYSNVPGTNFFPNWGQSTVASQVQIQGNNTLKYSGLNYQGIELASGNHQDVSGMDYLHLDVWTANSTNLNVYLISPGPVETPYAIPVPTSGWASVDIPLSAFAPVDLTNVFQFKFDGNGDIYIDNLLFYKQ